MEERKRYKKRHFESSFSHERRNKQPKYSEILNELKPIECKMNPMEYNRLYKKANNDYLQSLIEASATMNTESNDCKYVQSYKDWRTLKASGSIVNLNILLQVLRLERRGDPNTTCKTEEVTTESMESLEELIKAIYVESQPSESQYKKFKEVLNSLKELLLSDDTVSKSSLMPFGSVCNNFWNCFSDIDFTILIPNIEKDHRVHYLDDIICFLKKIGAKSLRMIINPKNPMVKFIHNKTDMDCDISVNNIFSVRNSKLIKAYSLYDERFRIMGYFIKLWAKANGILGASIGMLSSYSYLNMIIHYLQRVHPPVLPFLQKLHLSNTKGREDVDDKVTDVEELCNNELKESDVILEESKEPILKDTVKIEENKIGKHLYFEQDLEMVKYYMHEMYDVNTQTVSELICGFFKYYLYEFKRTKWKVNIKSLKQIPKTKCAEISIKDAFDRSHDPGASVENGSDNGRLIFNKFYEAYNACLKGDFYALNNTLTNI